VSESRLPGWVTPRRVLVVVLIAHVVLAITYVVLRHVWWEEDETVYVSQVALHKQAVVFTAPRARGMPILLWPVAHWTASLAILRCYLIVLGTALLYAASALWLRLGQSWLVPLGTALFCSLWTASLFGAEAQPNFLVAICALGVCGSLLLTLRSDARVHVGQLAAWMTLLTLLRPSDATWLTPALLVVIWRLTGPARRRRLVGLAAVGGGLLVGWGQWAIEAQVSYGGFFQRLHAARAENTPGLHFSLADQAASINGPGLCRPCLAHPELAAYVWWFAIPPLVVLGLLAVRRTQRFADYALLVGAGVSILLEYLLTIDYGAPRFLLPTYLLLALPCAAGVVAVVRAAGRVRLTWLVPATAVVLVGMLVVQATAQTRVLDRFSAHLHQSRDRYLVVAHQLREHGVRPPCVVNGYFATPIAYAIGCNDHPGTEGVEPDTRLALLAEYRVRALTDPGWPELKLTGWHVTRRFAAYLRPTAPQDDIADDRHDDEPTSRTP